jgi:P-type E1-E2 ATPase
MIKSLVAMPYEELLEKIMSFKIISRARPMDKQRLVRLVQQKGQVVAVTGAGTNDAPALNQAEVGLSMGDGTSVTKEASDITINDNSFGSISRAVMWKRSQKEISELYFAGRKYCEIKDQKSKYLCGIKSDTRCLQT